VFAENALKHLFNLHTLSQNDLSEISAFKVLQLTIFLNNADLGQNIKLLSPSQLFEKEGIEF
jgi:hypothetical protein